MNKHTPGPWRVEWGMAQGGDAHHIIDDRNMMELSVVATAHFHDDEYGETKANARLIAAAPDLYAALRRMADIVEALSRGDDTAVPKALRCLTDAQLSDDVYAARAALAKAEGQ